MATHAQVAASVRRRKERHPELYCSHRACLWNTARSGDCPKHGGHSRKA